MYMFVEPFLQHVGHDSNDSMSTVFPTLFAVIPCLVIFMEPCSRALFCSIVAARIDIGK